MYVHNSCIHNSQKLESARCPSAGEQLNKLWYIHTMEYNSTILHLIFNLKNNIYNVMSVHLGKITYVNTIKTYLATTKYELGYRTEEYSSP